MQPLLLLPGLGADERLFAAHRRVRDIRVIRWIAPIHPRESLADYAARLAREVRVDGPFDLGGASFGGMVALEFARRRGPSRQPHSSGCGERISRLAMARRPVT